MCSSPSVTEPDITPVPHRRFHEQLSMSRNRIDVKESPLGSSNRRGTQSSYREWSHAGWPSMTHSGGTSTTPLNASTAQQKISLAVFECPRQDLIARGCRSPAL